MMTNSPLRFGYFGDFADPTFLFFGGHGSLRALYEALLSLPSLGSIKIDVDPRFRSVNNEHLTIHLSSISEGMRHQADNFEWRLSAQQSLHFAEQVKGVIDSAKPCHDYLEIDAVDDAVVVVSKDEYPETWPHTQPA